MPSIALVRSVILLSPVPRVTGLGELKVGSVMAVCEQARVGMVDELEVPAKDFPMVGMSLLLIGSKIPGNEKGCGEKAGGGGKKALAGGCG